MKYRFIIGFLFMATVMTSCSPEVDLYADYKDIPIVYGILDSKADTTFIKITHIMHDPGNALSAATDSSMSDYPGKLDVRLTEFCNGDSVRQLILDTITVHDKQQGTFYAPTQKLYYTTERIPQNTETEHYRYRLYIQLPERSLTADALLVGDEQFYIRSSTADFSNGQVDASPMRERIYFIPAENAEIYEISMAFTYLERRTFTSDSVPHTLQWSLGTFYRTELQNQTQGGAYYVEYLSSDIFHALSEDIGTDTIVPGLRRYITDNPLKITITAGGNYLSRYYYITHLASQVMNGENAYSLIDGGYGVFSSKTTITRELRLAGTTVPDIVSISRWGFKFIGGQLPTE